MRSVLRKWGNSAALRVPSAVMEEASLKIDQPVDIRVEKGRIIVEPLGALEFSLDELLSGVTSENLHAGVDFGRPVGKEKL